MKYKQLITRRIFVICIGKIGLLFLLIGRMFFMQFLKKDEYKTLSDKNRIKILVLNPTRGKIFDINQKLIAENNVCFRLALDKSISNNFLSEVEFIVKILDLDEERIKLINKKVRKGERRVPITIIDYLDWKQIATIEELKGELQSIFIDTGFDRYYSSSHATGHLVGYLGSFQEKDKLTHNFASKNFKLGKSGIEHHYENKLCGEFGYNRIEVNAHGKYVRELGQNPSSSGEDLHLNIDSELQQKTLPYLDPKGCSAIVMNCQTGAILISHSTPSYDPNKFNHLSTKYWNSLINDPYKPLIDKTIQSSYPPGSIFKIITILAALEHGISPDHKVECTGKPVLGGNRFRCSKISGHGSLSMIDAIKHSCNSYIYDIAMQTGADKIIEVARKFGFGAKTNVDLPRELCGFVPDPDWKKKKHGERWSIGDTLNLALGQGFMLATPMQLVRLIAAIASNGKLFTPQIVKNEPQYTQIDIKQEHLDVIKTALYHTINSPGGTGYLNRIDYKSMHMAGKTGTAQVRAKKNAHDNLNRKDINREYRNHAIFSGFAPFSDPRFAVSVYYDHGGGGGRSATPIAKKILIDVMSKYL
ncbi:penicillin-binding protein 2 [Rickettsiaceae bacterium]|nr:penicillin-binding protein 2 [Rickettsiaceae bacterium]